VDWIRKQFPNIRSGNLENPFRNADSSGTCVVRRKIFLPFSPRWLVQQGRYEEALENLIHIHSNEGEEYGTKEFIQIREQIALETHQLNALGNYGLIKAFFSRRYRRRLMWVIFIQLATSLTGASVAATYQSIMFGNVGLSGHTLLLVSACYGFMGPSFSLMNILFIADRWGRRMTCFMGAFTLGIDLSLIMAL
jgi:hypothetical protein